MKNFKKIIVLSFIIFSIYGFTQTAFAVDGWIQQTGSGSRTWRAIASSADGTKLAAVVGGGYIYTSTDSGVTWVERTSAGLRNWYSIASSADGTKLAATVGEGSGYIYTSTDSGVTWVERTSAGLHFWLYITSSSDGTKLFATTDSGDNGYLFTSIDSGVTWTQQTAAGQLGIWPNTSSADGTKLAAAAYLGYIHTSTDSGVTWTQRTSAGLTYWWHITSSADGTKLAATVGAPGNYIYTSNDSGANWTLQTGSGTASWHSIASSADGTKLVAARNTGAIYISTDSGVTWTPQPGITGGAGFWRMIAMSDDGSKIALTNANGYIYTYGALTPATVTTGSATAIGDNSATLGGTITDVGVGGVAGGITVRGFEYGLTASYGSTVSDTGTYTTGAYTKNISSLTCDTMYHFRAYVTSPAGTSYGADNTFTTICPYVTNVTSTNSNGAYFQNDTVNIQITFSEIITVTGTPQLTLETGVTNRTLDYISGSGTTTLNFIYVIQSGDYSTDLNYVGTDSLILNGGTIIDSVANPVTLTLPTPGSLGSLSYNKNIEVAFPAAVLVPSNGGVGIPYTNNTITPLIPTLVQNTSCQPTDLFNNTTGLPCNTSNLVSLTPKTCPKLSEVPSVLKFKLTHPNVKILQELLNCRGYTVSVTGPGSVGSETTNFGALTQKAVKAFQAARGITVDGVVGPQTREKLAK